LSKVFSGTGDSTPHITFVYDGPGAMTWKYDTRGRSDGDVMGTIDSLKATE